MANKPHLNIVFIGHVDHGKSTTVGRLLVDTGVIRKEEIEKYRQEAEAKGKATFEFAWVMDRLKEERERGVTIDVAHKRFDTDKYYFTIIDAPGHRDFVKNMITGTSQADGAVIVCSAAEGVQEQTKEHIFLSRTLGVGQLIVAVNKMDRNEVKYSETRFKEIKNEVGSLLLGVGFKAEQVPSETDPVKCFTDKKSGKIYKFSQIQFLPISAFADDNIDKPSPNMPWWKGPTLITALNTFEVPSKPSDKALRLPVQDVYTITGIGTVPVGRVETGKLKVGDAIIVMPSGKVGEVKSIEMHHEQMQEALPGDNVGINIRGINKEDMKRGDVIGPKSNPPTVAKSFTAQIMVLNHPSVITIGYAPVLHCHTAQVTCEFAELLERIDPKTGKVEEANPKTLKTGDAAKVKLVPKKPFVIEKLKDFAQLGRFAIRDSGQTVAAGVVIDIEKKE
ncbi:MAG: translation elongation factor EF-1 subunit alpha [Candidatus Thermoplasmatota archaeon]|jgi:elongation factor 1-alpha|nr:translation elongation factor EF-1 subunit alpha [Candidatus Thermoplasmatota archaeon]MCL5964027.1 translation elongation factor EF-1 subunit alpha [Candidatus Thermoplasmatota archaeon]